MTTPVNSGFVRQMQGQFIHLNDPINRWGNLVSSYLVLPGLRAFYPGGAVGPGAGSATGGNLIDQSGLGNHLTIQNSPLFRINNLYPFVTYDGSSAYHTITDAASNNSFDILGSETYIASARRGLTMGCWARQDGTSLNTFTRIMSKTALGTSRSYSLNDANTPDELQFRVSPDGTLGATITVNNSNFTDNEMHFVCCRFTSSTELMLRIDDTVEVNTTSVPATIFNSSANFSIGSVSGGGSYWKGDILMMFVCATVLPDSIIFSLLEQGRVLFRADVEV